MREITLNRQKLGLEDLTFGVGTETQTRAGQQVAITKINAGNLPFDETQTLLEWAQSIDLETLTAITDELIAIYNNLNMLSTVEDNLVMLNAVEDSLTMLNSIYNNISKIQNVDTNMSKLQNIDTYMPELSTIYTKLVMLQTVYTNLTILNNVENNLVAINAVNTNLTVINNVEDNLIPINNVEDNLTAINSVNSNLTPINSVNSNLIQLLAIYSQVIPNLTELLQVNENAAQVAAAKITVEADKLTVAKDKADVSGMKSAVESIYDSFDDRFLGAKNTDPLVDNDGNPLVDGALYFNYLAHALKVYSLTDTTWYIIPQIYLSGLLDVQLTSITTGDILNWNGTKWVNTITPKFSTMQLTGGTGTEGTLSWNTDEGTVDIILPNGSVLQVGQEGIRKVRNGTVSTITSGTVVMFDGTIGTSGRIKVKPFTGGFNEAVYVYGIATQDIVAGADGIITTEGKIRGINTTGSIVGETWADTDILYAKPGNSGTLTKVVPSDTQLKMVMASVIHAHISGTLEIRFTPINENTWYTKVQSDALADIHSKTAKTTPVDADEIMIADSTSTWSLKKITWASIKTALTSLFTPRVATTTNKAIARYNGITGYLQNSAITIDDNGNVGTGTQSFNGFGGSGFKNYIINGNFSIWQRGTSFTGLTNGSYSADRWCVYDSAGNINYSTIRNAGIFQSGYGINYTFNSGTGTRSIIQFIENVTRFKVGSKVSISFEAYTDSTPYNVGVAIQCIRGIWAAATAEVSQTITLTNTKTRYEVTLTVPDWNTLGINWANLEDTKLALKFILMTETNGRNFIISNVQLEEGSIATPFENRPYGLELSLCQRYYQVYGDSTQGINIIGYSIAGQTERTSFMFPIQMRDNPNATRVGTWYAGNCSQPTIAAKSKNGFSLQTIVTATGSFEYTCNGTGQYLIFEKEL